MKKFMVLSMLSAPVAVLAEGGANPITGSNGILTSLQSTISDTMDSTWPIIAAVVAVGALVWLGYTLWGVIAKFFKKAKG